MFNDYELLKSIGSQAKLKINSSGKVKKVKREPESDEQKALIQWAQLTVIKKLRIGDYLTHIANEGKREPKAAKDFIELGGSPGYPDLMLDIPTNKYHGLRIEMKAPKPHKSVIKGNQTEWLSRLKNIGYCAVIVTQQAKQSLSLLSIWRIMSRLIELLSRMFEVRAVTADERGRQTLTGDVIIAVFGKVQHAAPVGFDLLMAKYVHDAQAADRMIDVMSTWLDDEKLKRKDLAMALSCVALNVFCDKPVASQHRQLAALWRKYSEKAKRSDRLVKRWQVKIKGYQRDLDYCTTQAAKDCLLSGINELEALIIKERLRLESLCAMSVPHICAMSSLRWYWFDYKRYVSIL
ncbi:hypothetical protein ACP5PY_26715 [Photobacterium leiognathi subsp. mandapamensis]